MSKKTDPMSLSAEERQLCDEAYEQKALAADEAGKEYIRNPPTTEELVDAVVSILQPLETDARTRLDQKFPKGHRARAAALRLHRRMQDDLCEGPQYGGTLRAIEHGLRARWPGIPPGDVGEAIAEALNRSLIRVEQKRLKNSFGNPLETDVYRLAGVVPAAASPSKTTGPATAQPSGGSQPGSDREVGVRPGCALEVVEVLKCLARKRLELEGELAKQAGNTPDHARADEYDTWHAALDDVILFVHERTGIPRDDLWEAAHRVGTNAGLVAWTRETDPAFFNRWKQWCAEAKTDEDREKRSTVNLKEYATLTGDTPDLKQYRDLTWILPKLAELDSKTGAAASLSALLSRKYPAITATLGIATDDGRKNKGGDGTPATGAPPRPPLSDNAAKVREILLGLPSERGLIGRKLLEKLDKHGVFIDQSTLTKRIIPELKPYGVMNKPRIGYYIPVESRPSADAP